MKRIIWCGAVLLLLLASDVVQGEFAVVVHELLAQGWRGVTGMPLRDVVVACLAARGGQTGTGVSPVPHIPLVMSCRPG